MQVTKGEIPSNKKKNNIIISNIESLCLKSTYIKAKDLIGTESNASVLGSGSVLGSPTFFQAYFTSSIGLEAIFL